MLLTVKITKNRTDSIYPCEAVHITPTRNEAGQLVKVCVVFDPSGDFISIDSPGQAVYVMNETGQTTDCYRIK